MTSNHAADQCLCFCNIDSAIPLDPKSKILSLQPSSVARHWSEARFSSSMAHLFKVGLNMHKTTYYLHEKRGQTMTVDLALH